MRAPFAGVKSPSTIVLAIYLLLVGLIGVFGISLGTLHVLVPLLALVAGVLFLIGR